jgi:hypothetical protein
MINPDKLLGFSYRNFYCFDLFNELLNLYLKSVFTLFYFKIKLTF